MYELMIFGAKNFLRIISKFPKIGLKKLFKNSKNKKIGENFDRWCDRRDLNSYTLRHYPLKIACLPIPPRSHKFLKLDIKP